MLILSLRGGGHMLTVWIHDLVSLFAVTNPFGIVPLFLALTDGASARMQKKTAQKACVLALAIGLVFAAIGQPLFHAFGITLYAFRVAGGIILFGIAYSLLNAQGSNIHQPQHEEQKEDRDLSDVAITPLATPLISGPGTLATLLVLEGTTRGAHWIHVGLVASAFMAVMSLTYAVLTNANQVSQRTSRSTLNLITRMMGLLLAVIAVQMVIDGLTQLFPKLST